VLFGGINNLAPELVTNDILPQHTDLIYKVKVAYFSYVKDPNKMGDNANQVHIWIVNDDVEFRKYWPTRYGPWMPNT
jgi:hypothetical protein